MKTPPRSTKSWGKDVARLSTRRHGRVLEHHLDQRLNSLNSFPQMPVPANYIANLAAIFHFMNYKKRKRRKFDKAHSRRQQFCVYVSP